MSLKPLCIVTTWAY